MKQLGSMVAKLAYGKNVSTEAVEEFNRNDGVERLLLLGLPEVRAIEMVNNCRTRFIESCGLCESPIEKIMLAHLARMHLSCAGCDFPAIHDVQSGEEFPIKPIVIVPQFAIARYRLDFLVVVRTSRHWYFDIECDGADFHNSIERRRRDGERDAYLKQMGLKVFRFTGQKISKGEAYPERGIALHIAECSEQAA